MIKALKVYKDINKDIYDLNNFKIFRRYTLINTFMGELLLKSI